MRLRARPSGPLSGSARAPGDKSISHRALILGALADGATEIEGLLEGDDVLRTADAMRAFGAQVEQLGQGRWRVRGRSRLAPPEKTIDCGNSGTGVRLLMGAAAGFPLIVAFDGDASLRRRPMRRVLAPLIEMNVRVQEGDGDHLPLTLSCGYLRSISYRLPVASAQVKSAVLLAGLNAKGVTEVVEPAPTRDHTERMLRAFGVELEIREGGGEEKTIRLASGQSLRPASIFVPGDPSSAAFPIVAALIVPGSDIRIKNVLLNPLRTGLYETLREMGADLSIEAERVEGGEPVGDLVARYSRLKGVVVPPERAPTMIDEYPVLAVAAAFADGETLMSGIAELRVKESDRIASMAQGLRACGADVEERPDGLIVRGSGALRGDASIETNGDHRIAMAHLIAGLAATQPIAVDEADMINTSFPDFAGFMRGLGAAID
jgi:3-phosphoshikimate 1-carboxyvinyltransferase